MPNFLFEFTDTTIQAVSTVIVADTQEDAQVQFDAGDWNATIRGEEVTDRSEVEVTLVDALEAQEQVWKNPLAVSQERCQQYNDEWGGYGEDL